MAFTTLASGTVIRWHADLAECTSDDCDLRHVSKAELDTFDGDA